MILYDYCRSSAAYRVRIALNIKDIEYQQHSVNLLLSQQCASEHSERNPQQLVPVLHDGEYMINQSLAICEYLDEAYPDTQSLLPDSVFERAEVRAFAQMIACETHPLNNLRVLKYLQGEFNIDDEKKMQWYHHWIEASFSALEAKLDKRERPTVFCYSHTPSLADICLIPQLFNARRFEVDLKPYPLLTAIEQACLTLDSFQRAHPSNQPDS